MGRCGLHAAAGPGEAHQRGRRRVHVRQRHAQAAQADSAGSTRGEHWEPGRERVHAHAGLPDSPHEERARAGDADGRDAQKPLRRQRRRGLQVLLLHLPVPTVETDRAGYRAGVRETPHQRRAGGAAATGAGLRELPGPTAEEG